MTWHIVLALFLGYLAGLFTAIMFSMASHEDLMQEHADEIERLRNLLRQCDPLLEETGFKSDGYIRHYIDAALKESS